MAERTYLSIGEVLALLKDEFPDITISKIRFLESQGLIDPERTPSGYRKFYDPDVERLRWILRQQKEHYLPLRVIRGRLAEGPADVDDAGEPDGDAGTDEAPSPEGLSVVRSAGGTDDPTPAAGAVGPRPGSGVGETGVGEQADRADRADRLGEVEEVGEVVAGAGPEPAGPLGGAAAAGSSARRPAPPFPESLRRTRREGRSSPAAFLTAPDRREPEEREEPPTAHRHPVADAGPRAVPPPAAAAVDDDVEVTAEELAASAGLTVQQVADLERYGLISGAPGPGGRYYDGVDVEVARVAAAFAGFGVEARHLKMWRQAAEREAAFYEQVVIPLRKQRNPAARQRAADTQAELSRLGLHLHALLVKAALDAPRR